MTTDPNIANLHFIPWVRQGAAAAISTVDTLGPDMRGVVDLAAQIAINNAPILPVGVRLRGPADVVGIDPAQIVRMEPQPGSGDFEPNYFASIEFDRADFPWLFTPASADPNAKLRPWLCLVIIRKQDGVSLSSAPGSPLTMLDIGAPASPAVELPDLAESWAWAHAQASADHDDAAAVGAAVNGAAELSLSRLICPRILAPSTDYIACVVPTFELGRKAGLGLAIADADLVATSALQPAWAIRPAPAQARIPVYHQWEFRTGEGGDFESLVRQLKPRAATGVGQRPIDVSQPGFALQPALPAGTSLGLEGALLPIAAPDKLPSWPSGADTIFQPQLAEIVNTPGRAEAIDPNADPLLAPPLYGRWYAARSTVTVGSAGWFDTLNLDPRLRSVASFGTRVVQEHQEALMASAWEQAAELRRANQRVRQLQLSIVVGTSVHTRHFEPLSSDALLRLSAPAFGRIRSAAPGETTARTVVARMASTALPLRATSSAMRIIGRTRGPLTRRVAMQGVTRSPTATWVLKLNTGTGIFMRPPLVQLATIGAVLSTMSNPTPVRRYAEVTAITVASEAPRPNFQISPEGQPVLVPPLVPIRGQSDNPTAAAFRSAAEQHLQRINPGRTTIVFGPPASLAVDMVRQVVLSQMAPRTTLVALTQAVVATGPAAAAPTGTPASAAVGADVVFTNPVFPQPMYQPLRDLSQNLLLPGLDNVLADTVLGLKTNLRFVESYMVGLNVEMGHELLWRGFPTDQRGTYFSQFWDVSGSAVPRADITDIKTWSDKPLGDPQTTSTREQFVMLMRTALLRRYPNAIIYASRALMNNGVRSPSHAAADEVHPAFRGSIPPDVSFFGFDLSTAAATGTDGSAGYYIVIQQHPTEPRFGVDVGADLGTASHLGVGSGPPVGIKVNGLTWGKNSAHMAGIIRQRPVRVAIHASQFVASA